MENKSHVLSITYIELKSPFHFFHLSYHAMQIMKQLGKSECIQKKTTGFWTHHYTMTLWESEMHLKNFSHTGAHLQAMKYSSRLAKQIRILTMNTDKMLSWKEAKKQLLENGKHFQY